MDWKDISLFTFQRLDNINNDLSLDDLDKVCYCTCELFGLTEYELDNMAPKKVNKLMRRVMHLMKTYPDGKAKDRIGPFKIDYEPTGLTLGQFIEYRHFIQGGIYTAHFSLASISRKRKTYQSEGHPFRADYFLRTCVVDVLSSLQLFSIQLSEFLKGYPGLFGLDKEMYHEDQEGDLFNKRFGWIYSATEIAEHERIALDAAYGLPIRQAFNDLMYLKEKARYMAEQQRKMMETVKTK